MPSRPATEVPADLSTSCAFGCESDPAATRRYVGDITYLSFGERGFLHLATVIDLHSRRLAGWEIADHMRTGRVIDALTAVRRIRDSLDGAIMHTDHGTQGRFRRS